MKKIYSPEELLKLMCDEMPFKLPDEIKPYIIEAITLYHTQFNPEEPPKEINEDNGLGICMEKNCKKFATRDYNGCKHFVCDFHFDRLSNEFDEEYR